MKKFSNFKIEKKTINESKIEKINEEEETEVLVTKSEPAKFVSKILESREIAHILHLKAVGGDSSYAQHKALEDYYEDIVDFIDDLVEIYQGQYGILENYELMDENVEANDAIAYFTELAEFIKSTKNVAFLEEDTHIFNIVDEIMSLIYKTLYKLKFLK